jgi:Na+-driven multidrug efflux pump
MTLIATDFTIGGAIRCTEETTYPLIVSLITLVIVRIILPFICIKLGLSLTTLFILTGADFLIKTVLMTW